MLKYRSVYRWLFVVQLLACAIYFFGPPLLPHITRQTDTMAITLRYWLRWSLEESPKWPLLPAHLGLGDFYAVQFMEFPLLNLLFAPLFALGVEAGRVLNNFTLTFLNLGLIYISYRRLKDKVIGGVVVNDAFMMLFLISGSGFYFYKQIPDFTAFALVLLSVAYSWDEEKKNFFLSFLFLALGVLIKPPQVVALGILLLHPNRKYILKCLTWIIPAAIPCGLYYTIAPKLIQEVQDAPNRFGTHIRNPLENLQNFFTQPKRIWSLLNEAFFGKFVFSIMLLYVAWGLVKKKIRGVSPLVVVLILETLGLIILDGDHLFGHRYYLAGIGFTAALIFVKFSSESGKVFNILTLLVLTGGLLEKWTYETRPLFGQHIYAQCSELKKRNESFPWGQNYSFRSEFKREPLLGLCFGEREGSRKNKFGFYWKNQTLPASCQIVDRTKDIILASCESY